MDKLQSIVWKALFNEDLPDMPDPNKAENEPYYRAKQQTEIDSLKRFVEGHGKILFDQWQAEIRAGMFHILTGSEKENQDELIGEIRAKLKLIASALSILAQEETT